MRTKNYLLLSVLLITTSLSLKAQLSEIFFSDRNYSTTSATTYDDYYDDDYDDCSNCSDRVKYVSNSGRRYSRENDRRGDRFYVSDRELDRYSSRDRRCYFDLIKKLERVERKAWEDGRLSCFDESRIKAVQGDLTKLIRKYRDTRSIRYQSRKNSTPGRRYEADRERSLRLLRAVAATRSVSRTNNRNRNTNTNRNRSRTRTRCW